VNGTAVVAMGNVGGRLIASVVPQYTFAGADYVRFAGSAALAGYWCVIVGHRDNIRPVEALDVGPCIEQFATVGVAHHVQILWDVVALFGGVFKHLTDMRMTIHVVARRFEGKTRHVALNVFDELQPIGRLLWNNHFVNVKYSEVVMSIQISIQAVVDFNQLLRPKLFA